ncbi:MAG TPA: CCC motif membrane protein [Fluviicola sp.]|nr:CCC motif membrane protein [Fluviicola sp.]
MDDLLDNRSSSQGGGFQPSNVPNASATLVLGIISIATCWLYGIPGLICGIIALVLHKKDKMIHATDPQRYDNSFKTSKAGFICAIVGTSLSALWLLYVLIMLIIIGSAASSFSRF